MSVDLGDRDHRLRRQGDLNHDLVLFIGLLREMGIPVPVRGGLIATRAMASLALDSRVDVHVALRSCLVAGADEAVLFDRVFGIFWSSDAPTLVQSPALDKGEHGQRGQGSGDDGPAAQQLHGNGGHAGTQAARRPRYSSAGRRRSAIPPLPGATTEITMLARRLLRALQRSRSRRLRSAAGGELIDIRESLRENLRHGEELIQLRRRQRLTDRARVVVLCDVSSSMQPFTPLFLTFIHALTRIAASVEAAIFNVEMCSVTDIFRRRPLGEALTWLTDQAVALAGGTRIGHCLRAFNREIAGRGLAGPRTSALILSDGWDVGEPTLLQEQMRRLRDQVGRLIWLDPHAAATDFRPQVRGLELALPHVDDYLDFSSRQSLRTLVEQLEARPGVGAR